MFCTLKRSGRDASGNKRRGNFLPVGVRGRRFVLTMSGDREYEPA